MSFDVFLGALDLARAYRLGETTASDAVGALLGHIQAHDPKLGAFQAVYADDALAAAEAADKARKNGHSVGPFHGIPFALKDVMDVEGRVTTGGSLTRPKEPATRTATVAQRLLAAGGILLGKTKTIEFSMGGWGLNQNFGTPWNPWDLDRHRAPGGSSSGSAVAVAAGMVPAALGTDTGGSVRTPSAWCGVVGLKTTHGVLPMDGIIPTAHSLDTCGPLVRCVADAAFLFDLLAGREARELNHHLDVSTSDKSANSLQGLLLGSLPDGEREGMAGEVLDLYDAALERLRALGAEVEIFEPTMSYVDLARSNRLIATAEAYAHYGKLMEDPEAPVDENVRQLILPGREIRASEYIAATLERRRHIELFAKRMRGFSALVTPTLGITAVPLENVVPDGYPVGFTRPFNYLAMCALSIPMGLTPNAQSGGGLPVGLQIASRGKDEAMALRIGMAFEAFLGGIGHPDL